MINLKKANPNTQLFWDEKIRAQSTITAGDYITRDRIKYIAKQISSNVTVLDVGFGYGFLEQQLVNSKLIIKLYGVDISEVAAKRLIHHLGRHFIVANANSIPFKGNTFDVICLLEVLEHAFQKEKDLILKEIYRLLKPNGKLIVSVPLYDSVFENHPSGHVRMYSPEKLLLELSSMGFKVLQRKFLYAFSSFYSQKSFFCNFFKIKQPNNLIVVATKK